MQKRTNAFVSSSLCYPSSCLQSPSTSSCKRSSTIAVSNISTYLGFPFTQCPISTYTTTTSPPSVSEHVGELHVYSRERGQSAFHSVRYILNCTSFGRAQYHRPLSPSSSLQYVSFSYSALHPAVPPGWMDRCHHSLL